MTGRAVLRECERRGVRLATDAGGNLICRARPGVLTPDLQHLLARHKTKLLALLPPPSEAADPPVLARAEALYAAVRAIRERPAREAALVAAWAEELVENPAYPDAPPQGEGE